MRSHPTDHADPTTPGTAPGVTVGPPPPPDGANRRRGWFVGGGIVLILVLALAASALVSGSPRSGGGPGPKATQSQGPSPTPPASSAPSATASPTLEQEREEARAALFRYFDAYAVAEKTLDPSPLAAVAAGQVLAYAQSSVEHDRSIDQPWALRADDTITSIVVAPGLGGPNLGAQVIESYVDHSVRLDPRTLQPIEPDPHQAGKKSYTLQEVAPGQWKVVSSTQIN